MTESELDDLVAPLATSGIPGMSRDQAVNLVRTACEATRTNLERLPAFVDQILDDVPDLSRLAVLMHVIQTARLLSSVDGCKFAAHVGIVASERLRDAAIALDKRGH